MGSRKVLQAQIATDLRGHQGNALTSFEHALPAADCELVRDAIKDPYNFEFLGLSREAKERDLEQALLNDVQSFLMEPEFTGKMSFYLTAVDELERQPGDDPSIGLVLCPGRGKTVTEWALRSIDSPVAIARYTTSEVTLTQTPPPEMQPALPDLPALASELSDIVEAANTASDDEAVGAEPKRARAPEQCAQPIKRSDIQMIISLLCRTLSITMGSTGWRSPRRATSRPAKRLRPGWTEARWDTTPGLGAGMSVCAEACSGCGISRRARMSTPSRRGFRCVEPRRSSRTRARSSCTTSPM
jgi:hypothetical protein